MKKKIEIVNKLMPQCFRKRVKIFIFTVAIKLLLYPISNNKQIA